MIFSYLLNMQSHPSWVCGLKQMYRYQLRDRTRSHPSWVCGLKLYRREWAWRCWESHPSWVCGLKHEGCGRDCRYPGHTLRGCVDWNMDNIFIMHEDKGHILRVCVDWNSFTISLILASAQSHPSWVCGMKQKTDFIFWAHFKKSFLRKRAIDCQ